jgi:hypothetical protein
MSYIENISLFRGNAAAGIHLYILADGLWLMNIIVLEKKKDRIHVINNYTGISTLEEVEKKLPLSLPIILSIEGKGVIHKKVNNADNVHLVQQVFPNGQPNDFFIQSQEISTGQRIISLIRKNAIAEIINDFRAKGYAIYNVFLGPFSMNCLWSSFDQQQDTYVIENYTILRNKDSIMQLDIVTEKPVQYKYSIGNEEIDSVSLIPYSNAVSFILKSELGLFISADICQSHKEQFIYKRVFQATAIGLLALLFIILLVNFLLFDKFNKEYVRANMKFKADLELVNRLDSIKAELKYKEMLVEENGLMTGTRYSFYANRIAALVPDQIVLTKLEINPALTKPNVEKELDFNRNIIIIKGKCLSGFILDEWMETIKTEQWVKRMEVLQYQQENKGTPGDFNIQIDY